VTLTGLLHSLLSSRSPCKAQMADPDSQLIDPATLSNPSVPVPPGSQVPSVAAQVSRIVAELEALVSSLKQGQLVLMEQLHNSTLLQEQILGRDLQQRQTLSSRPTIAAGEAAALFSRMLPLRQDDTHPKDSNIQVSVTLLENGTNFANLEGQLISTVQARNCQPALDLGHHHNILSILSS
jgi:hypothetical protein